MTAPIDELNQAIIAAVKADPEMTALISGRIYDDVPENPVQPYVNLSHYDQLPEDAEGVVSSRYTLQYDIWSVTVGKQECNDITNRLRRLVTRENIILVENHLVSVFVERFKVMRDPDGFTKHGFVIIQALIEEG